MAVSQTQQRYDTYHMPSPKALNAEVLRLQASQLNLQEALALWYSAVNHARLTQFVESLEEHIQLLRRGGRILPSAPVWFNLGSLWASVGDLRRAIEAYEISTREDESFTLAWFCWGVALFLFKRYGESRNAFDRCSLTFNPAAHARSHEEYGLHYILEKRCVIMSIRIAQHHYDIERGLSMAAPGDLSMSAHTLNLFLEPHWALDNRRPNNFVKAKKTTVERIVVIFVRLRDSISRIVKSKLAQGNIQRANASSKGVTSTVPRPAHVPAAVIRGTDPTFTISQAVRRAGGLSPDITMIRGALVAPEELVTVTPMSLSPQASFSTALTSVSEPGNNQRPSTTNRESLRNYRTDEPPGLLPLAPSNHFVCRCGQHLLPGHRDSHVRLNPKPRGPRLPLPDFVFPPRPTEPKPPATLPSLSRIQTAPTQANDGSPQRHPRYYSTLPNLSRSNSGSASDRASMGQGNSESYWTTPRGPNTRTAVVIDGTFFSSRTNTNTSESEGSSVPNRERVIGPIHPTRQEASIDDILDSRAYTIPDDTTRNIRGRTVERGNDSRAKRP
ncbi:hypothetical protein AJ80_03562 [Polytolypa hystricis UAMH7299]|uniref:Uncharacterized protein n=1 Tax=Polytolypa hystricis (strain UAMH7299) TaxID=1447883 RepID=A0A2B7YIH1_POLH7|nr:hypothetical protein AJ80_03562 [Polytolypa hystricis UAMH7299]